MLENKTNEDNKQNMVKDIISINALKNKIGVVMLASAFMAVCGIVSFFWLDYRPLKAILFLCTLFFVCCFVFLWKIKAKKSPILAANEQGMTDNSSALSVGFIAWEDIEEVKKAEFFGNYWIGINLKPHAYKKYKINSINKGLYKINKHLCGAEVCISLQITDRDLDLILQELESLWQSYKG